MKIKNTVTMEEVARKAGVSITTVSHVVNKTRHVNQETKDAVLRVIKELNYRSAKMFKSSQNEDVCIGVILADAREDYYHAMIKAIESAADDNGVSVVFCDSEQNLEKEENNINVLLNSHVNGLLLAPADADKIPNILQSIKIPVVLIDRQYEQHNYLSVGIDNFRSGYLGTQYILDRGCKKVGFIGYGDPVYTIRQRIRGFKSAITERDSATDPKVLYLNYNNGGDSFLLIRKFLRDGNFDGVVCATSTLCYELLEVLDTLDEDIQKKFKIVTFDDNRWFDYLKYPITVICQPVAEIGNAALTNLLQQIDQNGPSYDLRRSLNFDVNIIDKTK
jgi:LacI family transcriptional regulator